MIDALLFIFEIIVFTFNDIIYKFKYPKEIRICLIQNNIDINVFNSYITLIRYIKKNYINTQKIITKASYLGFEDKEFIVQNLGKKDFYLIIFQKYISKEIPNQIENYILKNSI